MSENSTPPDDLRKLVSRLPQLQGRQEQEVKTLKRDLALPDPEGMEAAAGLIYLAYPENTAPPTPRSLVGESALRALIDTLEHSPSSTARANAAWALGVVGVVRADVIEALIDALELEAHDLPDRMVAQQAAKSLARLDTLFVDARTALRRWRDKARGLGWEADGGAEP